MTSILLILKKAQSLARRASRDKMREFRCLNRYSVFPPIRWNAWQPASSMLRCIYQQTNWVCTSEVVLFCPHRDPTSPRHTGTYTHKSIYIGGFGSIFPQMHVITPTYRNTDLTGQTSKPIHTQLHMHLFVHAYNHLLLSRSIISLRLVWFVFMCTYYLCISLFMYASLVGVTPWVWSLLLMTTTKQLGSCSGMMEIPEVLLPLSFYSHLFQCHCVCVHVLYEREILLHLLFTSYYDILQAWSDRHCHKSNVISSSVILLG